MRHWVTSLASAPTEMLGCLQGHVEPPAEGDPVGVSPVVGQHEAAALALWGGAWSGAPRARCHDSTVVRRLLMGPLVYLRRCRCF
jgi:hypothetical protein